MKTNTKLFTHACGQLQSLKTAWQWWWSNQCSCDETSAPLASTAPPPPGPSATSAPAPGGPAPPAGGSNPLQGLISAISHIFFLFLSLFLGTNIASNIGWMSFWLLDRYCFKNWKTLEIQHIPKYLLINLFLGQISAKGATKILPLPKLGFTLTIFSKSILECHRLCLWFTNPIDLWVRQAVASSPIELSKD